MADRAPTGTQLPNSIARAWYGPGTAVPPVATPGTLPRRYDYPWNLNLNYAPRKYERVSFEEQRNLARDNYLVRVILETVKKRLTMVNWEFRLRAQTGEHLASVREKSASDSRVKSLYKFFERPDGEHDWPEWLNMLLEDRFVIDAATLWVARDSKDRITHLLPIDGSTINRVIDASGMTPQPPYAAYQQVIKGIPGSNFTAEDLVYMPYNVRSNKLFGYSEIEQTIRLGQTQINRAIWTLNHYTEGNIPEAFVTFKSTDYSADQMEKLMATIESQLDGNMGQRQRLFPLPDANIHQLRNTELYDAFDEWLARLFCYQMGEPPTALVKAVNRASAQQMDDSREESGEKPFINWIKTKLNRIIQNPLYFGWEDIECAPLADPEVDGLKQAQIWQIEVPLGITTVNEARIQQGKTPGEDEPKPGEEPAPEEPPVEDEEPAKAASLKKKGTRLPPVLSGSLAVLPMPGRSYLY